MTQINAAESGIVSVESTIACNGLMCPATVLAAKEKMEALMFGRQSVWTVFTVLGALGYALPSFADGIAPTCPAEYHYDAGSKHCESAKPPTCADPRCLKFNPSGNKCSPKFPPITACNHYFNQGRPESLNPKPTCPASYTLDPQLHSCISGKDVLCPSGYKFTPASNKCEKGPAGKAQ